MRQTLQNHNPLELSLPSHISLNFALLYTFYRLFTTRNMLSWSLEHIDVQVPVFGFPFCCLCRISLEYSSCRSIRVVQCKVIHPDGLRHSSCAEVQVYYFYLYFLFISLNFDDRIDLSNLYACKICLKKLDFEHETSSLNRTCKDMQGYILPNSSATKNAGLMI